MGEKKSYIGFLDTHKRFCCAELLHNDIRPMKVLLRKHFQNPLVVKTLVGLGSIEHLFTSHNPDLKHYEARCRMIVINNCFVALSDNCNFTERIFTLDALVNQDIQGLYVFDFETLHWSFFYFTESNLQEFRTLLRFTEDLDIARQIRDINSYLRRQKTRPIK